MGTTVATNALLERKGEPFTFVTTKGFKDLLHIGTQSRPNIFDIRVEIPEVLHESVIEVDERVVLQQNEQDGITGEEEEGVTGDRLIIEKGLDETQVREQLQEVYARGIRSLAVALMHSYTFQTHEKRIEKIAKDIGFTHVSLSSTVMPMAKIVPRGYTACADAYLTPCIKRYVEGFCSGFENGLQGVSVMFMQSDGGMTAMEDFSGARAILSGPAGGVVGYSKAAYYDTDKIDEALESKAKKPRLDSPSPVIGFDMGGTSTDVSRFAGSFDHVFETITAGISIQAPQLDINTVAAGGGSRLFFRSGMFVVGPESVGAHPGPVCYRKGGPLAVTDANLLLGRIRADQFPSIFGPNEDLPLDVEGTRAAFTAFTSEINSFNKEHYAGEGTYTHLSPQDVALGFIKVANEAMCRPIRALTQARGHDTTTHVLACFGGAGGQHACAVARNLGMGRIKIHKYAGILSAYGLSLADVVEEAQEPVSCVYGEDTYSSLRDRMQRLCTEASGVLTAKGFSEDDISLRLFLHMRYEKTDCALMVESPELVDVGLRTNWDEIAMGGFATAFLREYKQEFGFVIGARPILIDNVRVRASASVKTHERSTLAANNQSPPDRDSQPHVECYFEGGARSTALYKLSELPPNAVVEGPAIILDQLSTLLVEPHCTAYITDKGNTEIKLGDRGDIAKSRNDGSKVDPIMLGVFSHRFMSIAEQMGRVLQRTSISTNIKERLDFSCALFSPDGGLVANAPHIPVHLGSMQAAIQYQIQQRAAEMRPGDVLVTNHPAAGGSHLPDITVITPIFEKDGNSIVFFVASRGHHSDIGGITPGSMPPHSRTIEDEGVAIKSYFLVREYVFQEEGITQLLTDAKTRNLSDNLSDLQAQVAANNQGISLVQELMQEYGRAYVHAYMYHIQKHAAEAVREMLKQVGRRLAKDGQESVSFSAEDFMDDGSRINLAVSINTTDGTAVFDFNGTTEQVYGNLNAPKSIVYSAVIYCLRCLIREDVPLNQGCLDPVEVIVPDNSLLSPSPHAAVVGGNVLTSQRVVDTIFRAFGAVSASQGCMNNLTLGDDIFGYYETISGGSGAGPGWHGRSGVHTHMTNTRITDPEILEQRYPMILRQFSLRANSGGAGRFRGGDGVIREIEFRRKLTVSLLTERRVTQPYGLDGGQPGARGHNLLIQRNGNRMNMGGKNSFSVCTGDRLRIESPGGGGFGTKK
ncbi:5-oxoprolinase, variant [Sphaeroforma arctica JP610]|uniref:5-oxoprolinase, variant n=1 Tax=Sphaeroforma arctica JP610 TaxID=667725 RepID=A0A0L0FU03_9EUKA|nr:5-oxoprolinase, variant [Sphaeroforma arctica JP610]KNC80129.1 5-oxoprolinase, variant [Sphaeroforma arctica JP610]|eukprot:XP_014154031.1 5-oxoprolinase, variant [Sphaeroforma arctica JP610]